MYFYYNKAGRIKNRALRGRKAFTGRNHIKEGYNLIAVCEHLYRLRKTFYRRYNGC